MRKLTIRYTDIITSRIEEYVFNFDPAIYKDSSIFKDALCSIDPGDDYVVEFENYVSDCKHAYNEVGMLGHFADSQGCGYGCKVYMCSKCSLTTGMHNATYGCKIDH